ncbi:MAG: PEGA domain-containing protein [Calditrichaeota bacterium]|nr:PEGA domain-containing protein [Calditrichota bacterium]
MALTDRFEIESPIHVGQIATAYPAWQKSLDRKVLLKVIHPQWSRDTELVERFRREGQAVARLDHPNIVRIFDSGVEEGLAYLALEWIDGRTLGDLIAEGPLPQHEVLRIGRETLAGLAAVHRAGLVHRDLKPDNILLDREGRIKLADFSLAGFGEQSALTSHGAIVGSPAYLAPELLEGEVAAPVSDLYGLGVVLYEALTGTNPYHAPDPMASLDLIRRRSLQPLGQNPAIDPKLANLIDLLLERDPVRRPADAEIALQSLALNSNGNGDLPIVEYPHPPVASTLKPPEQPKSRTISQRLVLIGSGVLAILAMVISALTWKGRDNVPSSEQSEALVNRTDSFQSQPPLTSNLSPTNLPERSAEGAPLPQAQPLTPHTDEKSLDKDDTTTPLMQTGTLRITALPWAEVSLDDSLLGLTPLTQIKLMPGRYRLHFTHPNYPSIERSIQVNSRQDANLEIDFAAETMALTIAANPWGVLWIDGDSLGLLPREMPANLLPGAHLLVVRHPDYAEWSDVIGANAGEHLLIRVDLPSGTMIATNLNRESGK